MKEAEITLTDFSFLTNSIVSDSPISPEILIRKSEIFNFENRNPSGTNVHGCSIFFVKADYFVNFGTISVLNNVQKSNIR